MVPKVMLVLAYAAVPGLAFMPLAPSRHALSVHTSFSELAVPSVCSSSFVSSPSPMQPHAPRSLPQLQVKKISNSSIYCVSGCFLY